jgi:hypothetical protein
MCSVNIDKLRTLIYTREFKIEAKNYLDHNLSKISKLDTDAEKLNAYIKLLEKIQLSLI